MSEGTKGPRLFDRAAVPMLHQWEDDGRHWLLIRRSLTDPQEKRYYFVFASPGTTLQEMVKALGARWHIEEYFENAKDMGLDHYEVVRRESRASNCSYDTEVIKEPAVPPAVSLSSKAERQRSVRSLLTTTLNNLVASETVRQHWYLLASKRIGV